MTTTDVLRFVSVFASAIHTVPCHFPPRLRPVPPFAAIATLANLGNAYISWRSNNGGAGVALHFLLAGVCTASLVPFTLMFVVRSEGLLLEKAAEKPGDGKPRDGKDKVTWSVARTRELIGEWARLNYVRALFPLVGALISYTAH
ncbi:hypothetical protein ACCO45_006262 [Purpureocillium lilacinum]|uniref:Uncharacterized protein n=1 Tax=Purpureocillium lilacinum TaxID=33203 RepID=A0ACC4E0K3_PURLI